METRRRMIIPYQEINGNYNQANSERSYAGIIPYQEINGNYNRKDFLVAGLKLYHTKK